jgi:hypothetical protein
VPPSVLARADELQAHSLPETSSKIDRRERLLLCFGKVIFAALATIFRFTALSEPALINYDGQPALLRSLTGHNHDGG